MPMPRLGRAAIFVDRRRSCDWGLDGVFNMRDRARDIGRADGIPGSELRGEWEETIADGAMCEPQLVRGQQRFRLCALAWMVYLTR